MGNGKNALMSYRLLLHKSVSKFLEECSNKRKALIIHKLILFQTNPRNHPQLDIRIMRGYSDLYRLRIGQYRLIYQLKDDELLIFMMSIGSRGDVYKHL
jgi:mRNA interferase RelE/StbE